MPQPPVVPYGPESAVAKDWPLHRLTPVRLETGHCTNFFGRMIPCLPQAAPCYHPASESAVAYDSSEFFEKFLEYEDGPIPAVDPADLQALWSYMQERSSGSMDPSVLAEQCSPGADVAAVSERVLMLLMSIRAMAVPVRESIRDFFPSHKAQAPEYFVEAPDWLREDLNRTPLPEYVFEVAAEFPFHEKQVSWKRGQRPNFPALVAALQQARPG